SLAHPGEGTLVATQPLTVRTHRTTPLLWFSDARGGYRTSFEANRETIYVSGSDFPAGSTIELYLVADRPSWEVGDPIVDTGGWKGAAHRKRVTPGAQQTSFMVPVWPGGVQRSGRFDLIARVVDAPTEPEPKLRESDLVTHRAESGLTVRGSSAPAP